MIFPIGHDQTEVRRQPWVTFTIMGLCIAVHLLVCFAPGISETEIGEDLTEAVEFWMTHPYLELPEKLREEMLAGFPEDEFDTWRVILEQQAGPPPAQSEIAREQMKLNELVDKSFAGIGELPIYKYGLVPARMTILTLFTHMFLHVGWMHLLGNLFFLYLTGPFIEDVWGRPAFIGFYLLSGLASGGLFALRYADLNIPLVGASGAIAGCMGAFLIRYWHINIKFFYWIGFFFRGTFKAPAWLMLPLWVLRELFAATMMDSLDPSGRSGGTAFWAHVWGFMFGVGIAFSIKMLKIEQKFIHGAIEAKTTVVNNAVVAEALEAQDSGRTEEAMASLTSEVQRNPGNSEAVLALWGMAVGASRVVEVVPAMQRLLREEVRAGEFDLAMTHRAELSEFAPDAKVDTLVDLRLAEHMLKDDQIDQAASLLRTALSHTTPDSSPGMLTRLARLGGRADAELGLEAVELALSHPELPQEVREEFEKQKTELAARQPAAVSTGAFGEVATMDADGISIPGFEPTNIVEQAPEPEPASAADQGLVPDVGGDSPVDPAAFAGVPEIPGFEPTLHQEAADSAEGGVAAPFPTAVPPMGGDAPTIDPDSIQPEPVLVTAQGAETAEEAWPMADPSMGIDAMAADPATQTAGPDTATFADAMMPTAEPSMGAEALGADAAALTVGAMTMDPVMPVPVMTPPAETAPAETAPAETTPAETAPAEPDVATIADGVMPTAEPSMDAEPPSPEPVTADPPGPASLRKPKKPTTPSKKLELHPVEPLSIDGKRITVDVEGRGPSALGLEKVQAVSSAVIRPAGKPAFILIDLLLDPPWATGARLRVIRMRSGRMDPAKVIPDAPNSAAALRAMIEKLLAVSQGIPLPDARAVKGNPFREFSSLEQYELEVLHAG